MNECCSAAKNILASWTFSSFLTTRRSLYVKTNSNTKTPRCESSGVPKALGLLTSKGLPVLFPALRQHCNKHTRGGFVCAHRVFTWCRAPEVYSAWRGLVSELFHVVPSCVCVSECARVRLCVCVKTIFSHRHLLRFLNSDGANVSTSGPQRSEARGYFWTPATTTQYSQHGSKAAISHRTATASTSQDAVSHLKVQCHAEIPLTGFLW